MGTKAHDRHADRNKDCGCTPNLAGVYTNTELQHWYDYHGPYMTYNGTLWSPKSRRVAPNRHEFRLLEHKDL